MDLKKFNEQVQEALHSVGAKSFSKEAIHPLGTYGSDPDVYCLRIELDTTAAWFAGNRATPREEVGQKAQAAINAVQALGITDEMFTKDPSLRIGRAACWHSIFCYFHKDQIDALVASLEVPA